MTDSNFTLSTIFKYNQWANEQLATACLALSQEQLAFTMDGTYGSIHQTLWHIMSADTFYARELSQGEHTIEAADKEAPIAEIMAVMSQVCAALHEIATTKEGNQPFSAEARFERDTIATLLTQVIHHGNEHRTHITSLMGHQGIEPPDISAWAYAYELNG